MASDFHLKIEGTFAIPGESTHEKHKGEIDIESFSWGLSQPTSAASGGGGGAGKVSFSDINFMAVAGKHSPLLGLAACKGTHLTKATLSLRKAGDAQEEYYKIIMEDCLVSSVQHSGSGQGGVLPMESFALSFAKIEFDYSPQKGDGKLDTAVVMKYNLKEVKAG